MSMKWYWNHKRFYWIDLLIAGGCVLASLILCAKYNFSLSPSEASYSAIASLAGSLLGFLIAALTVFVGLIREEGMKMLRDSGHADTILSVFYSTLSHLGVTTLLAIIPLLVPQLEKNLILIVLMMFFLFTSVLRLQKCVWVLMKVIKIV